VILLADHRTPLQSREEIFAVADEDDADHEDEHNDLTAKPLARHQNPEWSDDEVDDDTPSLTEAAQGRLALLGNVEARQSWVDVGDIADHEDDSADPDGPAPRSELGAKAGVVLVSTLCAQPASHALTLLLGHPRASTTCS
jgi:solute carrier family 45 protein 1/2/4